MLGWVKKSKKTADFAAAGGAALNAGNAAASSFFKMQAFTTAVVKDAEIRKAMGEALQKNLDQGGSGRDYKKVVDDEFDRRGMSRLKPHQVENIYRTNAANAFAAGQMSAMVEVSEDFPFWKYSATMDGSTRPSHMALHGKIFKNGDFTFFPPIDYGCRCTAIPLTARQAGQYPASDMPQQSDRQQLRQSAGNGQFIGNKQESYVKWLKDQRGKVDEVAQKMIDKAVDDFQQDIDALRRELADAQKAAKTAKKATKNGQK